MSDKPAAAVAMDRAREIVPDGFLSDACDLVSGGNRAVLENRLRTDIADALAASQREIARLRKAVTVASRWFGSHQYTGDGLTVCELLREVANPAEVAKAEATERQVSDYSIAAARRESREEIARLRRALEDLLEEIETDGTDWPALLAARAALSAPSPARDEGAAAQS